MNPPGRTLAGHLDDYRHGAVAPGLGMEAVRGFAVFLHFQLALRGKETGEFALHAAFMEKFAEQEH